MPTLTEADLTVSRMDAWPVDVELTDAFVIAQGAVVVAQNLFVRLTLAGGAVGYGECAPFVELTGEDRAPCLAALNRLEGEVVGRSAWYCRSLSRRWAELEPAQPAARCGLETALVDAYCRAAKVPLWAWWGGGQTTGLVTDITIPILPLDRSLALADEWHARGFRIFKLKIGSNYEEDLERVRLIAEQHADVSFVLDANQGFDASEALALLEKLAPLGARLRMFEQPVPRDDLAGMARVRAGTEVPIAADESVATVADARRVIELEAADIINLKITKSGLFESLEIANLAHALGLKLTIGGMVETRLAMGCSLALAAGLGWMYGLDLDTPLLMRSDPLRGGFQYDGPRMLPAPGPGLGTEPVGLPPAM